MRFTQAQLKRVLRYDPATGHFYWLQKPTVKSRVRIGGVAGGPNMKGYWTISVFRHRVMAHVLAWLYTEGVWPDHEIDHRDGDGLNNRRSNLRAATHKQNLENRKRENVGVTWDPSRQRWVAQIKHNYERIFLGRFVNKTDAIAARKAAENKLFTHHRL